MYVVNIVIQVGGDDDGGGSGPPNFQVSNLGAPDQVAQGETATVDTTIENTGGQQDTQNGSRTRRTLRSCSEARKSLLAQALSISSS